MKQTRETMDKSVINKIQRKIENIRTKIQEYANEFENYKKKAINEAVNKLEKISLSVIFFLCKKLILIFFYNTKSLFK